MIAVQGNEHIAEIKLSGKDTDDRHHDVINQRAYQSVKAAADDNADSQVNHIALQSKLFELF
jgi:hypothetical protein